MRPVPVAAVGISPDLVPRPATNLKKPAGKASKGGRGSWIPPNVISPKQVLDYTKSDFHLVIILFRWEAARDWKEANPKGTLQNFNIFWDSVQEDKDKLQVMFVLL